MIVILLAGLITLSAVYLGQKIRKNNVKIYIAVTLISTIAFIMQDAKFTEPILQGFVGLSFLYIVMITGILKKKAKLTTKLMGLRREFSIIGFIFITPHGLKYLLQMLDGTIGFEWFGIIAYAIMIPLFITSFMVVRKKFTFKTWKSIQRFAYIVYILLFIHLIIISAMPNFAVYLVLFVPYIILKPIKEFKLYNIKRKTKLEKVTA